VTVAVRPAPEKTLRARRRVVTESRVVEVPVWHERIEIERVPVEELVTEAPSARYEGDVLVIPCVEEIPVVEVRLRVREELRVRVVRERRIHRETVSLHRHDIDIQTTPTDPKHEGD
jgi:stress response protein YsnF